MLDFFISAAHADGAAAPASSAQGFTSLLIFIPVLLVMYLMVIRPQSKRAKAQRELVNQLSKGDEVSFAGGLMGRITKVVDNYVKIEIADGTELSVQKNAVIAVLPKGTLKSI